MYIFNPRISSDINKTPAFCIYIVVQRKVLPPETGDIIDRCAKKGVKSKYCSKTCGGNQEKKVA